MILNELAKKILCRMIELSDRDLFWLRHEVSHSLNILAWLEQIMPDVTDPYIAAALMHDCDRYIAIRRKNRTDYPSYNEYKAAHADNSAIIATEILQSIGRTDLASEASKLIRHHEVGDTKESALLTDADSLSYFDTNIFEYFREWGAEKTEKKYRSCFIGWELFPKKL